MRPTIILHRTLLILAGLTILTSACVPIALQPATPTASLTPTVPSLTPFPTSTDLPTATITLTPTDTATPTETFTPSETSTPTASFTATLKPTRTLPPSATPTPILPIISVTDAAAHVSCRYGPGAGYIFKIGLIPTNREYVIGRMQILSHQLDGSYAPSDWLLVQSLNRGPLTKCWVNAKYVKVDRGDISSVPDYFNKPKAYEIYGASQLYSPVTRVTARRDGNTVTIFWQPIYMTEDDYVGYMIEAFVCYKGQYWFLPYGYSDSFNQNMVEDNNQIAVSIRIPDEPGCSQPSKAQIFLAEKHGYSTGTIIAWPPYSDGASATGTPSPTP